MGFKDSIENDSNSLIENIINITNDELIQRGYEINPFKIDFIKGNLNEEEMKKFFEYIKNMQTKTIIYSIFSLISEEIIYCYHCSKITFKGFNSTIVQKITLDINNKYNRYHVYHLIKLYMKPLNYNDELCSNCKSSKEFRKTVKIIKLPEILIFSLERKKSHLERSQLIIDYIIDLCEFASGEKNHRYKLFALNIKLGNNANNDHYICQVEREGIWYQINDHLVEKKERPGENYNNNICGLFYKRITEY